MIKAFFNHQLKYGSLFRQRLKKIQAYYHCNNTLLKELEAEKLKELLHNTYKHSSFYKNLYDEYGVILSQIQNREDLKKLPLITKQDIKDKVDEIYFGSKFKYTTYTSGTTGSPLKIYYSLDCVLNEAAYNEIFRNNAGHRIGMPLVSLRGKLDRSQFKAYDRFSNTLNLSSYNLNKQNFKFYYNEIKKFQPNAIIGYPSSFESLANYLQEEKLELNVPLIFTSSESLYDFQREKIERFFNAKVYDRYGNAERTISLVQEKHKEDYKEAKLYSINEYHADHIITTNLISPTFPLIRYQVDDVVELKENTSEVAVKNILGRIDDVLLLPDGTQIGRMNRIFSGVDHLQYSQIVQDQPSSFTLNLVKSPGFTKKDEQQLIKNIKSRVGEEIKFKIKSITEKDLIKTKKGKYKLVINKAL